MTTIEEGLRDVLEMRGILEKSFEGSDADFRAWFARRVSLWTDGLDPEIAFSTVNNAPRKSGEVVIIKSGAKWAIHPYNGRTRTFKTEVAALLRAQKDGLKIRL